MALENGYVNGTNGHSHENGNGVHMPNGYGNNADHSDDEYIDTVEVNSTTRPDSPHPQLSSALINAGECVFRMILI